jgi:hypothetical protein
MFEDEENEIQEVLTCSEIAEECTHQPLFNVTDSDGEDLGTEQTLSDILELIADEADEDAVNGFRRLIEAEVDDVVQFCGLVLERTE